MYIYITYIVSHSTRNTCVISQLIDVRFFRSTNRWLLQPAPYDKSCRSFGKHFVLSSKHPQLYCACTPQPQVRLVNSSEIQQVRLGRLTLLIFVPTFLSFISHATLLLLYSRVSSFSYFSFAVPMREVSCMGYTPRAWDPRSVQSMLNNPLYLGVLGSCYVACNWTALN